MSSFKLTLFVKGKVLELYQAGKSGEEIASANAALNEFKSVFIKAHRSQKLNQGRNSPNVYDNLNIIFVLKGPYSQKFLGSVPLMECLKPCLHWRRLRDNPGDNDSDSDMKQYLHWPP